MESKRDRRQRDLTIGTWGRRYSSARKCAGAYEKSLWASLGIVVGGEVLPTQEQEEYVNLAVRMEYLARCCQIDSRYCTDGKDEERIGHRQRMEAFKQFGYFTKERIWAVRQLGLVGVEVGRVSEGGDPFSGLDGEVRASLGLGVVGRKKWT